MLAVRRLLLLCSLLLPLGSPRTAAGEPVQLQLSAELGPQYDSNVTRVTTATNRLSAPLLRLVTDSALSWSSGRHTLAAAYSVGAKLYLADDGRAADELAQRASAAWRIAVGPASIALGGSYYDSFLRGSDPAAATAFVTRWDIRTGGPYVRLALGDADRAARGWLQVGYQGFEFKSQPDFDFHALALRARVERVLSSSEPGIIDWVLSATYTAALRAFAGRALGAPEQPPCPAPSTGCSSDKTSFEKADARGDVDHLLRLRIDYLGPALASLWYALEVNQSNSYGQSFVRHALALEFTTALVWRLYLTARGVLQLSSFPEQLLAVIAGIQQPGLDAENRSRLKLQLARSIGDHWSIDLRYAVFVNESGSRNRGSAVPSYLRHTVFLGARFEYER